MLITPCSDAPTTCSANEVSAWLGRSVAPLAERDTFADPPGIPGDAVYFRPRLQGQVHVDLVLDDDASAVALFDGLADDPVGSEPLSDDPGLTRYDHPGSSDQVAYTAWGIDSGPEHGAVLLIVHAPAEQQPTGVEVVDLLRGLTGT